MERLWFKRKTYGWGWVAVTWEGWAVVMGYILADFLFALTIREDSSFEQVLFTFLLPLTVLTIILFRILYAKGEKPRWQWGNKEKEGDDAWKK